MRMLEKIYRSRVGRLMSFFAMGISLLQKPFMVYGFRDSISCKFNKYTRLSSTVVIMNRRKLSIGNYVWVWHYSILDATEGLTIGDGCQIGAWVGIFTHGSENSIRLLGPQFINVPNNIRYGYSRGPVRIGEYTFIGAGSIILPGITIGKGCLIGAKTLVTKDVPDFSVVVGIPGKIVGNTLDIDSGFFSSNDFSETYYNKDALAIIKQKINTSSNRS